MTGPKAEEVKKEINKLEDSKIALKGMEANSAWFNKYDTDDVS